MNETGLAAFLDSFERCIQNDKFITVFYDIFLGSSDEIPGFFVGTNFAKQRRVLKSSLYEMVAVSARRSVDPTALDGLTERHQALKIQARHYELWLESLISAAAQCDPYFTAKTAQVWREAFDIGIEYMKSNA